MGNVLQLRSTQSAGVLNEAEKLCAMARGDTARSLFYVVEDDKGKTYTGIAGGYLERPFEAVKKTVDKAVTRIGHCDHFKTFNRMQSFAQRTSNDRRGT